MRKVSNVFAALGAAAVCALMTYLTVGSGLYTMIYNLAFLALMLFIIILALAFAFRRMRQTERGLDAASKKLMNVYQNRMDIGQITKAGSAIFEVEYLDRKYQEYLGYLRKTNSPCDIGDYIGEYEINNYTHRRLAEMVPDVLTSLGILGTFVGLVWGLKGFNPVSYEAMAGSITSLIDGIKVAFVTSIYGISLSLAYSYALRGTLTSLSESLDNFLDKYYLCAVSPTDATAMNHVLANQREQIRSLSGMGEQLASGMADHMEPVMSRMNRTLEHFTQTVTLNQQELLERIAVQVMTAMKREFFSEFVELRGMLKEANQAQKEHLAFINEAQRQFKEDLSEGALAMRRAAQEASALAKDSKEEAQAQQQNLGEFVGYMTKVMEKMSAINEQNATLLQAVTDQAAAMERLAGESARSAAEATSAMASAAEAAKSAQLPPIRHEITDIDELTDRLDQMIGMMEREQRQRERAKTAPKRGWFR